VGKDRKNGGFVNFASNNELSSYSKRTDFLSGSLYVVSDFSKDDCHPGFHILPNSAARTE
jgi:hypothetical protein